jgi:hypothetical protein
MTGRALLNIIEAEQLQGLDEDTHAQIRWSIHDPAGFAAAQSQRRLELMTGELGGEVG